MRTRFVVLLAVAVVVGCGDDDESDKAAATQTTAQTESESVEPTATTKAPTPKPKRRPTVNRREAAAQVAFTELVEAYELSDQPRICALLGQSGTDAESCAMSAGVNLMLLPSSEELSVEDTVVEGNRAGLQLSSGTTVSLRRSGGKWAVTGLKSP